MTKPRTVDPEQGLSLEQRRSFLKLSIEERRRQMAEQAARMVQHYDSADQVQERAEWQGGDLVELS
jgi:hypothetical protein